MGDKTSFPLHRYKMSERLWTATKETHKISILKPVLSVAAQKGALLLIACH